MPKIIRPKKKINKPLRKIANFNVASIRKEIRKELEGDYLPIYDLQTEIEDFLKVNSSLRNDEYNLISDLLDQVKEVKSNSVEEVRKQLDTIKLARKVISDNIEDEDAKKVIFARYDTVIGALENQLKKQNGIFATINRKFGKSSKGFLRGTVDVLSGGTPILMKTLDLFLGEDNKKKDENIERISRIERLGKNLEYSFGSSRNSGGGFMPNKPSNLGPSIIPTPSPNSKEPEKDTPLPKEPSNAPEFPAKFKALIRGYEVANFEPSSKSEPKRFNLTNDGPSFDDTNIVDAINRVDDRLNRYFKAKLLREDLLRDQMEARMEKASGKASSINSSDRMNDKSNDKEDNQKESIFEKLGQLSLLLKGSSIARKGFGLARRALGGIRGAGSVGKMVGGLAGASGLLKLGGLGKILGSAGKLAKGIPIAGQVIMAVSGIFDAFEGFQNANKFLLKKDPTFVDKGLTAISNIGGGFLSLIDDVLGWFGVKTNIGESFTKVVSNGLVNLKDGISESFIALKDKMFKAISEFDTGALINQITEFIKNKFGINITPAVDKAKEIYKDTKAKTTAATENFIATKNKVLDPVKEILGVPTSKQIAAKTANSITPVSRPPATTIAKPVIANVGKSEYAKLGEVSTKGETGGLGSKAISFGLAKAGDIGGVSYGIYQMTSQAFNSKDKTSKAGGTVGEFMTWMKNKPDYKPFAEKLEAAGGVEAANSATKAGDAFPNAWLKLSDDPKFKEAQHDFIGVTHYEPVKQFANSVGMNVDDRGMAVKQMLFAASVNTPVGTKNAIKTSLGGKDLSKMSDEDLITAIQNERMDVDKYYKSSPEKIKKSVKLRFGREKEELLTISKNETALKPATNESGVKMAVNSVDNRMAKLESDNQRMAPVVNVPPANMGGGGTNTTVIAPNAQPRNNESTYQRFQNKVYGI